MEKQESMSSNTNIRQNRRKTESLKERQRRHHHYTMIKGLLQGRGSYTYYLYTHSIQYRSIYIYKTNTNKQI